MLSEGVSGSCSFGGNDLGVTRIYIYIYIFSFFCACCPDTLLDIITSGACGEVWRASVAEESTEVAVKIMFVEGRSVQASRAREVARFIESSKSRLPGARYDPLLGSSVFDVSWISCRIDIWRVHSIPRHICDTNAFFSSCVA